MPNPAVLNLLESVVAVCERLHARNVRAAESDDEIDRSLLEVLRAKLELERERGYAP